jgi:stage II sporulation protein M
MNLKKELKSTWKYIKESKNFIYAIAFIFFAGALVGFLFSQHLTFLDEILKNLIEKTKNLRGASLIFYIFLNNLQSAVLGLVLGIFLGIFPVWVSLSNGVVVGYVLSKVYATDGFGKFWLLLPHGIFELPAIFISLGLGIKLGFFVFSINKKKSFLERAIYSLLAIFLIIIPLLLVAAIIEGLLIGAYK